MADVANDRQHTGLELPIIAPPPETGAVTPPPTLADLVNQGDPGAVEVLTGEVGMDRPVLRVTLLTAAALPERDLTGHLVLTTTEALAEAEATGRDLVAELAAAEITGLAVQRSPTRPVPASALAAATGADLPLVALDGHASLDGLVNAYISRVHGAQRQLLERTDEVHRALLHVVLTGGDLRDLCEQLVGLLHGAAVVTSTDGRVLAGAGAPGELDHAMALDCFDRTGRFIVEYEPVGIRTPTDVSGSQADRWRRAMVRIVAGAHDHGRLVAFSSTRALTADDVHLLERAATVAALAITKQQAVSTVEGKYRAEFLRDALAGRAGDPQQLIAHAESLGWDLGRPAVVVVAEIDADDEAAGLPREEVRAIQERFARAWAQAVRVRDTDAPCVGFSREVVTVLGVGRDQAAEATMQTVRDVVRVVRGDGGGGRRSFSTGVSRPITTPAQLPSAYEEALKAVAVGRQVHGDGALTHFDGLGIFRLLALVPDSADLRRFVTEALGDLATDAARENADLRQTLTVLLDTNLNVAETARVLHFHYNTLRYRITKLERMVGPFTTDPQLRLTLALALKVIQMRGL